MKKVTKILMVALFAGMCSFGYGQEYLNPPKRGEKVLETISVEKNRRYTDTNEKSFGDGWYIGTKLNWFTNLMDAAKQKYPNKTIDIRSVETGALYKTTDDGRDIFYGPAVGKVIEFIGEEAHTQETLSQAINKALRNVREGSRIAIDQVTVWSGINREDYKDQLIDVLLDKGYKVVAKDYLEKLYEEQQKQQSGIYNDRTTVQENNFSAVGYFINVKVTETSLRVQVLNVSTGEYEGNATVNF